MHQSPRWLALTAIALWLTPTTALSQTVPLPDQPLGQPPNIPDAVEETLPSTPAPLTQPRPLPSTPTLQAPFPLEGTGDSPDLPPDVLGASFSVETVDVVGNTVLVDEIAALVQTVEGRDVTFEELLQLRSQLTQLYIENGYITSGAFLPNNQDLSDGTVEIQIVEGTIEAIQVNGLKRLRESYVRDRLKRATQTPLNRNRLEEGLQLLQIDPHLLQVDAELTAGSEPGQNLLILDLVEDQVFHAGVSIDNYRSPSIGSLQGTVRLAHDNLLGLGDRLSGSYSLTEGLDLYDISYAIPVNPQEGTLSLRFSNSDSTIIQDAFRDLDIDSETRTISAGFRQPLWRSPTSEFALGVSFDLRHSQTSLLGRPFSFSQGPDRGESKVTVLRFSQDWVNRSSRRVLAARSQFSFGIDALDATVNDTGTDGRFVSWLGQFQWVELLPADILLLARANAQFTPDSLLSLERFSVGGVGTVRGYAQNQLVADNGVTGSFEAQIPVSDEVGQLQVAPFVEFGTVWNRRGPNPDPSTLVGLGLGVRWAINPDLTVRLDYGIPLIPVEQEGNSLQESGLYFSVDYQAF